MFELNKAGNNTYYLKNATNIGLYTINDKEVYIIDSGNDKEAGKKILKLINENNWIVKGIILTHSNADHMGGNKIIEERTNAITLAHGIEASICENPILEPSFLYGGFPYKDLTNKLLMAKAPQNIKEMDNNLPDGLDYINLKGHYFDQVGIKTSDNVYFLGDSIFSKDIINKYSLFYIYDVKSYLESLDIIDNLEGNLYIPSHAEATNDIHELVKINKNKVNEITNIIKKLCLKPMTFEQILKNVFDHYNLLMTNNQYVLIGNTVRSYLSYLYNEDILEIEYKDNYMFWKQKKID